VLCAYSLSMARSRNHLNIYIEGAHGRSLEIIRVLLKEEAFKYPGAAKGKSAHKMEVAGRRASSQSQMI
jgi:hypothetical protein